MATSLFTRADYNRSDQKSLKRPLESAVGKRPRFGSAKLYRSFGRAVLGLLGVAVIGPPLAAQTVEVRGSVKDATGAVIENATVQSFQGANLTGVATTGEDGSFSLRLPPGEYRIEVSALNFATWTETVAIQPQMAPLAVVLELAPILQTLEVQDQPYQISLEPDRNLTGLVLDEQAIQDLPDDEEELAQLLRDLAGPGADAVGGAEIFTDGFSGGRLPPRDQIREIRINNNPFSAENSRQGRGRIEIITRAGTDALRGNVSFEIEDEALNARNAFADTKPPSQKRDWRVNLSGPVQREKMSFSLFARRDVSEESGSVNTTNTPDLSGPVNRAVVVPSKGQDYNGRIQYQLPKNNFLNVAVRYGSDSDENEGVGGFTLPERATESESKDFSLQVRETAPISERLVLETRFSFGRERSSTSPVTEALAIDVLDAFEGGGATDFGEQTPRNFQFHSLLSYSWGGLSLKTGFQGDYQQHRTVNRDNFLGTFEFSDLESFIAGRPTSFTINSGDPILNFNQFQAATFLQTNYRATQNLMLSFGVRYEAQTNIGDKNNFDPRFGFAYSLGGNSVIRGGVGLFHQRLNAGTVQSLLRLDGTRQIQTVLRFCTEEDPPDSGCAPPSFPDPFAGGGAGETIPPPSVRQAAEHLATPYTTNAALSFETRLPKGLFVSVGYDYVRGIHLYRSRNINAPLLGETERPDPSRGNVLLLESSATSRYQGVSLRVNQRIGPVSLNANYTYSSSYDDTNSTFSLPADNYDLSGEWGRSSQHRRHSVFAGFNLRLPWNLRTGTRLRANSGRPFNITTGRDDNNDTFTNDRPAGVTRNTGQGPGFFNLDLSLEKTFVLKRRSQPAAGGGTPAGAMPLLQRGPGGGGPPWQGGGGSGRGRRDPEISVSASISNVLNRTNFTRFSGVLTSPFFGRPNSASSPREIELEIEFRF